MDYDRDKFRHSWYYNAFNNKWRDSRGHYGDERSQWKLIVFLFMLGVEPQC